MFHYFIMFNRVLQSWIYVEHAKMLTFEGAALVCYRQWGSFTRFWNRASVVVFLTETKQSYEWKDWLSLYQKWKEPVTVDIEGKGESKYF